MKNCPYCQSDREFYFRISSRTYYRCLQCDLIYKNDLESYNQVANNYSENYFAKYSVDQMEGRRNKLFSHILDAVEEKIRIGKLLDVGTGCGFFLSAASQRGWEAEGIEPSLQSVEVARRENSLNVLAGTLQDYKGNCQFDVITFINVLEHSSMPWLEIARAKQLLRPGGLVYLRFPNDFLHSRLFRMADKYSLDFSLRKFLVFHIYSFTPKYIKRLLRDHGFIQTTIINSPPSEGDPHNLFSDVTLATRVKKLFYLVAKCTEKVSRGQLFMGTSLEVTAIKALNVHGH